MSPSQHKIIQREKEGKERRADELGGKGVTEMGLTCLVISLSSQARVSGSESSEGQLWLGIFMSWGLSYLWLAVSGAGLQNIQSRQALSG